MAMDPMTMMMLASLAYSAYQDYNQDDPNKSTYTDQQQNLINQATNSASGNFGNMDITQNPQYKQGNDWLMSMFSDPNFFKSFEAPLMRQFQEQTMPQLENQYAALGTGGGFNSSAFRNQAAREGTNLYEKIAQLRGGMQQNAIPQLFNSAQMPISNQQNLVNTALGFQPNNVYQPPGSSFGNLASPMIQGYLQGQGMNNMAKPESVPQVAPNPVAGTHPSAAY